MSLFLKTAKYKNGKTYLSIVDGYRVDGKVKQKVYKKIGYLEDLEKQFDDPFEFLNSELANLKKEFETKVTATFDKNEFEDYFVKDAMLFYYLFTELFLMVDNRAKNFFATTFDGIHWFGIPYDFDLLLVCLYALRSLLLTVCLPLVQA